MADIGPTQLLLIASIVVLIFGATRLPEVGRGLGRGVAWLRRGLRESRHPSPLPAKPANNTQRRGDLAA